MRRQAELSGELPTQATELTASTSEMTSGVTRSGLWSVGGQAAVLLASLIATPFVVRLLRPELYGLLALIQAIIGYISFAHMGTTLASTKLGADAHAHDDGDGEVAVVWTSLAVVSVPAFVAGVVLVLAAAPVMHALSIPPALQHEAVLALRIAAIGFIARSAYGCLNTPQAVRLRWDLTTKIEAGTSILQIVVVPVVLALGGGLVAAVGVSASMEALRMLLHIVVSRRLQPRLFHPIVRRQLVSPLLRLGGALAVCSMVIIPLCTVERLFVARFSSVAAVAHYSLAATMATLLSVFPMAVTQPLLPAFTRLHANGDTAALRILFSRVLRVMLLWTVPATVMLCVIAKPAFTIWAGPEYGRHSTGPFYILAIGLAGNAMAYPAANVLIALDRAAVMARYYLIELVPYIVFAGLLTRRYGVLGAASAYSIRMFGDWLFFSLAVRKAAHVPISPFPSSPRPYVLALAALVVPVAGASTLTPSGAVRVLVGVFGLVWYVAAVITRVLAPDELRAFKGLLGAMVPTGLRRGRHAGNDVDAERRPVSRAGSSER